MRPASRIHVLWCSFTADRTTSNLLPMSRTRGASRIASTPAMPTAPRLFAYGIDHRHRVFVPTQSSDLDVSTSSPAPSLTSSACPLALARRPRLSPIRSSPPRVRSIAWHHSTAKSQRSHSMNTQRDRASRITRCPSALARKQRLSPSNHSSAVWYQRHRVRAAAPYEQPRG